MYEYNVIPAPLRPAKIKGLKSTEERYAHLLSATLNAEASEGWEFLRAETLPCEERKGLTGTSKSFQTMLVFRRPLSEAAEPAAALSLVGPAANEPTLVRPVGPLPENGGRAEPVVRTGAALPASETAAARPEPTLRAPRSPDDEA